MSRIDEPLTLAGIWSAADMTIASHGTRQCRQCTADGCKQLAWAVQAQRLAKAPGATAYLIVEELGTDG